MVWGRIGICNIGKIITQLVGKLLMIALPLINQMVAWCNALGLIVYGFYAFPLIS